MYIKGQYGPLSFTKENKDRLSVRTCYPLIQVFSPPFERGTVSPVENILRSHGVKTMGKEEMSVKNHCTNVTSTD